MISLKGVCDMHVHTNPDLRLRAYNDFELADAAIRVGARAIVIKSHQGFTATEHTSRTSTSGAFTEKAPVSRCTAPLP